MTLTTHQRRTSAPSRCASRVAVRAAAPVRARRPAPRTVVTMAGVLDGADDATKVYATYAALGLGAAGFVTTFFVLPQFRDLLKEPEQWQDIYRYLVKAGSVKAVPASEACSRAKRGAVLVDVRLGERHEVGHAENSISVPLYRPIQGWDVPSTLRRAAFSLFGIFPATELNPDFIAEAQAAIPKGKEVLLMCESGGSLQGKVGAPYGFQSRSLKAAYFLSKAGYNKVSFCQGGFPQWQREGLPVEQA